MKLYGIPNCNTVKKARTWLIETHRHPFHDSRSKRERGTAQNLAEADQLESWLTPGTPGANCLTKQGGGLR